MLLVLDESLVAAIPLQREVTEDIREALDIIGDQIYFGRHALFAPQRILSHLLMVNGWSRRLIQVLKSARDHYSERQRLFSAINLVGNIHVTAIPNPSRRMVGNRAWIDIPLAWIDRPEKLNSTVVLGENLDDVAVYDCITKAMIPRDFQRAFPISMERGPGGGGNIGQVFDGYVNSHRNVLCFVDSDYKYAGGPIKDTARQIQDRFTDGGPALAAWSRTRGRDLENTLPDAFYVTRISGDANKRAAVNSLESLSIAGELELRYLIDLCDGHKLADLFSLNPNNPERTYWIPRINDLMARQTRDISQLPCLAANTCANVTRAEGCTCLIFPGFGKSLGAFVQYCSSTPLSQVRGQLSSAQAEEWQEVAELIFDWCCANRAKQV